MEIGILLGILQIAHNEFKIDLHFEEKIEFSSQTGLNTLYLTIRLCRQY